MIRINKSVKKINSKRLGRGNSSKVGNTCCRGQKGQKSRSGYSKKVLFEGGQTPFYLRLPKVGFRKARHVKFYSRINTTLAPSHFNSFDYFKRLFLFSRNIIELKFLENSMVIKKRFFWKVNLSNSLKMKTLFTGGYSGCNSRK